MTDWTLPSNDLDDPDHRRILREARYRAGVIPRGMAPDPAYLAYVETFEREVRAARARQEGGQTTTETVDPCNSTARAGTASA